MSRNEGKTIAVQGCLQEGISRKTQGMHTVYVKILTPPLPFVYPVGLSFYINSRCGHCREFARSYDNIAANFHIPSDQGFRVGKVDCVAERALNARFGIQYLPTFFVIDGWSVYQFDEPRSESSLIDFLRGGYKKQSVRFENKYRKVFLEWACCLTGVGENTKVF